MGQKKVWDYSIASIKLPKLLSWRYNDAGAKPRTSSGLGFRPTASEQTEQAFVAGFQRTDYNQALEHCPWGEKRLYSLFATKIITMEKKYWDTSPNH